MKIAIRAKLADQKRIYRDIAIDGEKNLYSLAEAVTAAFGFAFDHCFGFFSSPDIYGRGKDNVHYELFYDIGGEVEDLTRSVKRTKIQELFAEPGSKRWMLFDYGDDWVFELVYQKDNIPPETRHGSVLKQSGEAPEQYSVWK